MFSSDFDEYICGFSIIHHMAFSIWSCDFDVTRSDGEEVWSPGVPPNVEKLATAFPHITSQVKRKYKHR